MTSVVAVCVSPIRSNIAILTALGRLFVYQCIYLFQTLTYFDKGDVILVDPQCQRKPKRLKK